MQKMPFKIIENKLNIYTFALLKHPVMDVFGFVAQLNRAPDYGSGGFRFES